MDGEIEFTITRGHGRGCDGSGPYRWRVTHHWNGSRVLRGGGGNTEQEARDKAMQWAHEAMQEDRVIDAIEGWKLSVSKKAKRKRSPYSANGKKCKLPRPAPRSLSLFRRFFCLKHP